MTLAKATKNLRNNRKSGAKTTTTEIIVMARSNRNLCQHNMVDKTPHYLTIGRAFTQPTKIQRHWAKGEDRDPETTAQPKRFYSGGEPVDVVRPWKLVKALYRHGTWAKNRIAEEVAANNAALLKGVSDEV